MLGRTVFSWRELLTERLSFFVAVMIAEEEGDGVKGMIGQFQEMDGGVSGL
ncbi:MAG: hypothetical protein IKL07_03290 [Clostridium sp.]|nr:hypothetical protein [Clostridium sp.]